MLKIEIGGCNGRCFDGYSTRIEGESSQLWMAHAAITTAEGHVHEQRFARGGVAQTGVKVSKRAELNQSEGDSFSVWIDELSGMWLDEQQWMDTQFPYWEGVVNVGNGKAGVGYMELTAYPIIQK